MRYLLDTHTFLWSISESMLLPDLTRSEIRNPKNEVFVSSVNLWEIALKVRIGRLDLGGMLVGELIELAGELGYQLISLSPEEAITYGSLEENSHHDPFDRMLIWQAIGRNLTIISKDSEFEKFIPDGLKLLWK